MEKETIQQIIDKEIQFFQNIIEIRKEILNEIYQYLLNIAKYKEKIKIKSQASINEYCFLLEYEAFDILAHKTKMTISEIECGKEEYTLSELYEKRIITIKRIKTNKKNFPKIIKAIYNMYYKNNNNNKKLFGIILASKNIMFNISHLFFSINFEYFFNKITSRDIYLYIYELNYNLENTISSWGKNKIAKQIDLDNEFFDKLLNNLNIKDEYELLVNNNLSEEKIDKYIERIANNEIIEIEHEIKGCFYIPIHLSQINGILFPYHGNLLIYNLKYAVNENIFYISPNIKHIVETEEEKICIGKRERIIGQVEYVFSIANFDSAYFKRILSKESLYLANLYSYFSLINILKKMGGEKNENN